MYISPDQLISKRNPSLPVPKDMKWREFNLGIIGL